LWSLAQEIARVADARFGLSAEAANSVGAELVGALPHRGVLGAAVTGGLNARQMITEPRKAYVLLNTEVEFDSYNPQAAVAAMHAAETVIALSAYQSDGLLEYADVLLPIAPFTETAGSFVNMEGRLQTFNGVVQPQGEARPAWKVLRVLGVSLGLSGFEYTSVEEVRAEWQGQGDVSKALNNQVTALAKIDWQAGAGLVRVGEVPIYQTDPICRRAPSLQQTDQARHPGAYAHASVLSAHGLTSGSVITVRQGAGQAKVSIEADDRLPPGVVRLATAHPDTAALGGMFDPIEITQG
jgi:NADH-quinone oxidoreductase subunit G